jgi:hypothetical protein
MDVRIWADPCFLYRSELFGMPCEEWSTWGCPAKTKG